MEESTRKRPRPVTLDWTPPRASSSSAANGSQGTEFGSSPRDVPLLYEGSRDNSPSSGRHGEITIGFEEEDNLIDMDVAIVPPFSAQVVSNILITFRSIDNARDFDNTRNIDNTRNASRARNLRATQSESNVPAGSGDIDIEPYHHHVSGRRASPSVDSDVPVVDHDINHRHHANTGAVAWLCHGLPPGPGFNIKKHLQWVTAQSLAFYEEEEGRERLAKLAAGFNSNDNL
ncbi:uncharacterized protein RAG0_15128 [Rhynchosporium agropyri]|uniref:Uncharacterized protein n=1 Tax=Rhynchosporium agropyri TaxID=914238 RepID=A0A1E1LJU0_9HELO|nr:uncharacterized protein RAG0_15128 [Rhynchosporium agropyri]